MIPTHLRLWGASVWHHTHGLALLPQCPTSQTCGERHQNPFYSIVQSRAFFCKLFAFLLVINFSFPDKKKGSGMLIQEKLQNGISEKRMSQKATLENQKVAKGLAKLDLGIFSLASFLKFRQTFPSPELWVFQFLRSSDCKTLRTLQLL